MTVVGQSFDMTLNFGNLIVFSEGNTLLFINDRVVDDPVGLITCATFWIRKTVTPLGSCGSAFGILDVSNLCRPGTEEKVEDEVLGVLCGARDIARER